MVLRRFPLLSLRITNILSQGGIHFNTFYRSILKSCLDWSWLVLIMARLDSWWKSNTIDVDNTQSLGPKKLCNQGNLLRSSLISGSFTPYQIYHYRGCNSNSYKNEILKIFREKIQKWFLYDYIFARSSQIWSSQRIFLKSKQ